MTENEGKRPQFGGRVLVQGDDVFKHNAWDNVDWDEGQVKPPQIEKENSHNHLNLN